MNKVQTDSGPASVLTVVAAAAHQQKHGAAATHHVDRLTTAGAGHIAPS